MRVTCIHVKCFTEVNHIVSSSTNPGVLFSTCSEHVTDVYDYVTQRFRGNVTVSGFSRIRRVDGYHRRQAA